MRRLSSRELKRIMGKFGVNTKEVEDVKEVILKTSTKEIIIQDPMVTLLEVQGQKIFQIFGEKVEEKTLSEELKPLEGDEKISDEDVLLVAQQANVDFEEAKAALKECKGDLAQAILMLTSRKKVD
ncbi:nascent polypeptide-associated complex protein [Candidatus Bathyarchaeota archaeon]|nr:MAG: nascent polypeptide-associated complex protein [Candidatus Bathyarchaeota archaeon]